MGKSLADDHVTGAFVVILVRAVSLLGKEDYRMVVRAASHRLNNGSVQIWNTPFSNTESTSIKEDRVKAGW